MALYGKTTLKTIQEGIDHQKAFKIGNVSASVYGSGEFVPKGRLPDFVADQLNARKTTIYVIFSYQTPIAWCNVGINTNWFIPDVKYSVSTSNHQSVIRVGSSNPGFYNHR
jgi:hypothetical protein